MQSTHVVAKVDELKDGQMKSVEIDGRVILLARVGETFYACSGTCPHHGAPLVDGSMHEGRVRCPWHQAVFDAATGRLFEPPSLDGLETYEVVVDDQDVCVVIPDKAHPSAKPGLQRSVSARDMRKFVVLGAGAAGVAAVEALRTEGFSGAICMITGEKHLPYDRTELSKNQLSKPHSDPPFIRSSDFYSDLGIDLLTDRRVTKVDISDKKIFLVTGDSMSYDRLLLASGAVARKLGVEGEDLEGIFPLRSLNDCQGLRSAAGSATSVVVIGASFIGMEVSAALAKRGLKVTVVAPDSVPFERIFGSDIGRMYQSIHEEKGVTFHLGRKVKRFLGNGVLQAVELDDGTQLETGLAVVGVGVQPATDYLRDITTNEDGSVPVDAFLRAADDVWAAGDIASFPDWRTGEFIRVEHWRLAQQHGRVAAMNMIGNRVKYRGVPFFWTNQFMTITDYIGHCAQWDEVVLEGDPARRNFLAFYLKDASVHAVAACGRERESCIAGELLAAPCPPSLEAFQADLKQRLSILQ
jgi:apoptosis-inducing factor 3